jgi:hypothetical protein
MNRIKARHRRVTSSHIAIAQRPAWNGEPNVPVTGMEPKLVEMRETMTLDNVAASDLRDQLAGGARPVEFADGARAGRGIVLGAILGILLWLLIILATASFVSAL